MNNIEYKHDLVSNIGFNVSPEQLAHDLTLLKLSRTKELTESSSEYDFYDAYVNTLKEFITVINDKISYDSSFSK